MSVVFRRLKYIMSERQAPKLARGWRPYALAPARCPVGWRAAEFGWCRGVSG
jgi:hypothetical protein